MTLMRMYSSVFQWLMNVSCRRWRTVLGLKWASSRVTSGCCQMTWKPCSRPFSQSCLDFSIVSTTELVLMTQQPPFSSRSAPDIKPSTSHFFLLKTKILLQVQSGAKTPFKKWLLNFAVDRKFAEVKEGIVRNNSIWDKLIFHKVQVLLQSQQTQIQTQKQIFSV